jgi:hypothetical protein
MMRIVRWALVLPAALAAWYAVFLAGLIVHGWVERTFCRPEEMVSGVCGSLRMLRILHGVVVLFVALSAVAVELAAVLTAPEQKLKIAWITFAVGSALAIFMAIEAESPMEGVAAVAAGLLTALAVTRRRWSRSPTARR